MQVLLGDPVNESTVTMAETIARQGRQNVTDLGEGEVRNLASPTDFGIGF